MGKRFDFSGDYSFRVVDKDGLLAFFDFVDIETGLQYRDFVLREYDNREFVTSPSSQYKSKEGMKWKNYVDVAYNFAEKEKDPRGEEWFATLLEEAIEEYEYRKENEPPKRRTSRGKPSGRGGEGRGSSRSSGRSGGGSKSRSSGRGRSRSRSRDETPERSSRSRSGRGPVEDDYPEVGDDDLPDWPQLEDED